MNKGQSNVEHNLRVIDGIINEMTALFYTHKKNAEDTEQKHEHLGMLAGKIGYLTNISVGATKTWNYEERIMKLERERNNPIPEAVRKEYRFNPDIMLTVVRDEKGKLMN